MNGEPFSLVCSNLLTSGCGSESWAQGVTVIDSEEYVLSIQVECQSAIVLECPVTKAW